MSDRRTRLELRHRFEQLRADLLQRLRVVCAHLPERDREALSAEMTRRRIRWDYGLSEAKG